MEKYLIYPLIFFVLIFSFSCGPKQFVPFEEKDIKFEKVDPYTIDLDSIIKPEKINVVYLDSDFKETEIDNAKYVLLTPQEYAKIPALLRLCRTYKDIILEQEKLINIRINKENLVYDYIYLEQEKKNKYKELWAISENAYREERYYSKLDKTFSYIMIGSLIVLSIIVAL